MTSALALRPLRVTLMLAAVSVGAAGCTGRPEITDEPPPSATLSSAAPREAPANAVWIPGGRFMMGSENAHASAAERPKHLVHVDGFFLRTHAVTNAEFRAFVEATGYVTVAERDVDADQILSQLPPGTPAPPAELLVPGSLVFAPNRHVAGLDDWSQWWRWLPGASWRHPDGPVSTIDGKDDHPVVHVAWEDAVAYATWAGGRLPTEAEWEFAARGGPAEAEYAWGDAPLDPDRPQAHIYEGAFPTHAAGTRAVGSLSPNGYGLYDMAGNVWEWTNDWFAPDTYALDQARGVARNPVGPDGPDRRPGAMAARVLRGGSFLCSDSYCRGYRVSARSPAAPDSGASHIGFRIVVTTGTGGRPSP